jgi:hypothetical protein
MKLIELTRGMKTIAYQTASKTLHKTFSKI